MTSRLDAQMAFLTEADRLKSVLRATPLCDNSRRENSGEHSWHLALYAMVLAEHGADVSIDRVIRMLLIHDLVEIDAGDVPIYGAGALDAETVAAREQAAANRIFGLLPADQATAFRALWEEFEANETPDARFAKSLDRFQPPNQNLASGGGSWIDYAVTWDVFREKVGRKIESGAPALWDWIAPKVKAFIARLG
ncbi:HD domain-containing protein [Pseudooceanicola sp. 216_PA32_1]|uniref:HD domain-containing protein n=1 Tax=Pseudooceanicola pacificus TaxID=2676438 RepID=A0A844W3B8_9RHOB|nr:HD domain-containing protein [Pseudooceanicola pacificus]MWB77204.1 HD domain-containing protein [Pseudooceanicola pacificus]